MMIERVNYPHLGEPLGPFSHAVIHNATLYTSGLTAFGTPAQHGTISEQCTVVFLQLEQICQRHQVTLENLIKVTLYVSDMSEIEQLRETLFNIYAKHIPASSLIEVSSLFCKDLKIEIEAIIALEG